MVSSGASSSSQLLTHLPPGTAQNGFNVTVVVYASDNLGARAATSLGVDGAPLAFVSSLPDQVSYKPFLALPRKTLLSDKARANIPFLCFNHWFRPGQDKLFEVQGGFSIIVQNTLDNAMPPCSCRRLRCGPTFRRCQLEQTPP